MRLRCASWPDNADGSEIRGRYLHDTPLDSDLLVRADQSV